MRPVSGFLSEVPSSASATASAPDVMFDYAQLARLDEGLAATVAPWPLLFCFRGCRLHRFVVHRDLISETHTHEVSETHQAPQTPGTLPCLLSVDAVNTSPGRSGERVQEPRTHLGDFVTLIQYKYERYVRCRCHRPRIKCRYGKYPSVHPPTACLQVPDQPIEKSRLGFPWVVR